jgi:hypothetical protein
MDVGWLLRSMPGTFVKTSRENGKWKKFSIITNGRSVVLELYFRWAHTFSAIFQAHPHMMKKGQGGASLSLRLEQPESHINHDQCKPSSHEGHAPACKHLRSLCASMGIHRCGHLVRLDGFWLAGRLCNSHISACVARSVDAKPQGNGVTCLETSEQDLGTSDLLDVMCGARTKRCTVPTPRGARKIHPVCLIPILADYESKS